MGVRTNSGHAAHVPVLERLRAGCNVRLSRHLVQMLRQVLALLFCHLASCTCML